MGGQTVSGDEHPDVLIAEMSHRWFNGLQVIHATLHRCQRHDGASPTVRRSLSELSEQVQAMAALHRRLSAHRAPGEDLQRHCLALCTDTVLSFGRGDIALSIEAIDAPITRRCEQRLALLLVELTTNAIKHGRAPDAGGEISIRLHRNSGEELELVVENNFGPPPFVVAPEPTFVAALVAEMGGALDIGCRPFYRTLVRFPAQ